MMRKICRIGLPVLALAMLILAAVGIGVARVKMLDPVAVARDYLTGYQAGSDRHRNAAQLPTPWDPIGDANRRIEELPPEDCSYPLFAEANALMEAAEVSDLVRNGPQDETWPETVEWLNSELGLRVTATISKAVSRPHAGFPISDAPDPLWESERERAGLVPESGSAVEHPAVIDALLPVVGAKRKFARHLSAEARLAIADGDAQRFEIAKLAIADLTRHSYTLDSLIEYLVDLSIIGDFQSVIQAAMHDDSDFMNEPRAALAEQALDRFVANASFSNELESESVFFEDLVRRMVNERGVFDKEKADQVLWGFDSGQWDIEPSSVSTEFINEGLWRAIDEYRSTIEEAKRAAAPPFVPYGDFEAQVDRWKFEPDSIPGRYGKLLLGITVPAVTKVSETSRTAQQRLTATRIALAAHRHHLRHGQPPASLDAIDADLIAFDPIDGFTGGRLVYRWTDAGHLVYAAGPDGDDDGGRPIGPPADGEWGRGISDRLLEEKPDGDYILFPPQD